MPSNFNFIKTFVEDNGQVNTLALDDSGVLWEEDVTSNPGVLNAYDSSILPGSFARSVTAEDEEWMVFSNLVAGTDIPRHASNLDRISQVGPGAGPSVAGQSGGTNVYDILASPDGLTQQAAFSNPANPGHFQAVSWSAGSYRYVSPASNTSLDPCATTHRDGTYTTAARSVGARRKNG